MFCKECGTENSDAAKFCKECGVSLKDKAVSLKKETEPTGTTGSYGGSGATGTTGSCGGSGATGTTGSYAGNEATGIPGGPGNSLNGAYSQANPNSNGTMYQGNYNPGNSDATVALILGIISILMCSSSFLAMGVGVGAIIFANKATRQGVTGGAASAGKTCGIIGICLSVVCTLYYILTFFAGIFSAIL